MIEVIVLIVIIVLIWAFGVEYKKKIKGAYVEQIKNPQVVIVAPVTRSKDKPLRECLHPV